MTAPGLRDHFFRTITRIGFTATLIAWLAILIASYIGIRTLMIFHIKSEVRQALDSYEPVATDSASLKRYLHSFAPGTGFMLLCAYDAQNRPLMQWHAPENMEDCPALMVEQGIYKGAFTVHIAVPMMIRGEYRGILYAESELPALSMWAGAAGGLVLVLLTICWVACWTAASWISRSITAQLGSITQQVECLKNSDIAVCALPIGSAMAETAALSGAIESLRQHLDATSVPKSHVTDLRRWHWEVLSGLLSVLRHRVDADSPLVELLSDYALLAQIERGDLPPPQRPFDLPQLLNDNLVAARKSCPPQGQTNLTASLQSDMMRYWTGQPEIFGALLKHLFLIGLKRTRNGFVCLRLEAASASRLHLAFEDSGPQVQHWQLKQWLEPSSETLPVFGMADDISWLLVARLFKRLGCDVSGAGGSQGGMILECSLPLLATPEHVALAELPAQAASHAHASPPLVLLVENDPAAIRRKTQLFAAAGCRLFAVTTHAQALEWASALPFSAIVLNATLPQGLEDAIRRLKHMKEDGRLRNLPCWMLIARYSFIEFDYWRRCGISELLLKPLAPERIGQLSAMLEPTDVHFFQVKDPTLHGELMETMASSLPEMGQMLAAQVAQLLPSLRALAGGAPVADLVMQAHAVKSAALNLGYFRLAGLMGQIEHAPVEDLLHENWNIIADCLADAWGHPTTAQPSAPIYHHNVPGAHSFLPAGGALRL